MQMTHHFFLYYWRAGALARRSKHNAGETLLAAREAQAPLLPGGVRSRVGTSRMRRRRAHRRGRLFAGVK